MRSVYVPSRLVIFLLLLLFGLALSLPHANAQETPGYMLAVVGNDGNLSVFDANGANPFTVTTDAKEGVRLYQWPTWSTDGRLAFFGRSQDKADPYGLRVFVQDVVKPGGAVKVAYSSPDDVFTYAYWSPGNCLKGNCRDLALLFTPISGDGLALRMIRDNDGNFTHTQVGTGAPFYYSFSPDGQQMFWYRDGAQFEIYDVAIDKITQSLDDIPGQFQAPMWSPVDDRILVGVANTNEKKTDIAIVQGADRNVLLSALNSPVSFGWSPDGQMIDTVAEYKRLSVVDVQSGKELAKVGTDNIVSHFWSPKSDRVAYIVFQQKQSEASLAKVRSNGHVNLQEGSAELVWNILDVKTGKTRKIVSFTPTRDMIYYLQFFDQFSRSHSLWSPDGRYLTYGGVDALGESNVYIIDTLQDNASPTKVAAGSIGIWSWK
jgi:TolB protein